MGMARVERILTAIASQPDGSMSDRLCTAAAEELSATGVSVALAGSNNLLDTISATPAARGIDTLQSDLGEGPSYDAHRDGWPVLVEDLDEADNWPIFGPAAAGLGVRSVFAFPLRRGAVRLGAFTLSRPTAGDLTGEEHADALVFARLALDLVLTLQADTAPGMLDENVIGTGASTSGIHQATGMVSVQLGITVGAALAVLRAHAYADGRNLHDVANDVVARRLRLE